MWDNRFGVTPSFWMVYSAMIAFWSWNRARLMMFTFWIDVWEPTATLNWRAHLNSWGLRECSSSSKSSNVVRSVDGFLLPELAQPMVWSNVQTKLPLQQQLERYALPSPASRIICWQTDYGWSSLATNVQERFWMDKPLKFPEFYQDGDETQLIAAIHLTVPNRWNQTSVEITMPNVQFFVFHFIFRY